MIFLRDFGLNICFFSYFFNILKPQTALTLRACACIFQRKAHCPCSQYLVPSSFLTMQARENAYEVLSNTERVGKEGKGESNANRLSNLVSFLPVKQGLCSTYDLFCRILMTL